MRQRGRRSAAAAEVEAITRLNHPPTAIKRPRPPDHLGEPEKAIWDQLLDDYRLATDLEATVLTSALEAHQRARTCRERILVDGETVFGRDNQLRAHPLLAVERDARAAFLQGLKALGIFKKAPKPAEVERLRRPWD